MHTTNPFNKKTFGQIVAVILITFTVYVWQQILWPRSAENAVYFLDVGQGDSELITLVAAEGRDQVKIVIDTGRNRRVLETLDEALGSRNDKYIDIILLTHDDLDHIGGTIDILKHYEVGLLVWNGREGDTDAFRSLVDTIADQKIPTLILGEGDSLTYGDAKLKIISPDHGLLSAEDGNEASLVAMLEVGSTRTLFTGDLGISGENRLIKKDYDLKADILKVGHHGSKNSSGDNFVALVAPIVSGIGVGKNNYGHPTEQVLGLLNLVGSKIYRTDEDGTVKIVLDKYFENKSEVRPVNSLPGAIGEILTGGSKNYSIMSVSLPRIKEEQKVSVSALVSHEDCSFNSSSKPKQQPVIFNEIAWMGAASGSTHEWLELKNILGHEVDLSGWQLLNENEKIKFTFPQQTIFTDKFIVLARTGTNEALDLNANLIFTGAIRNSKEGLRLFDNKCNLIDEVFADSTWPAGDNKTKQTMERVLDLSWQHSDDLGGTPGY